MTDHARVTPEGRVLGAQLARLADPGIQQLWREDGEPDDRCTSCAFRLGTVPNGCPQTGMDALKCVLEGEPFLCHMREKTLCHGWVAARVSIGGATTLAPWEFSPGDVSA